MFPNKKGQVFEWFKKQTWKVCVPQKGTEGSNPSLSAMWNEAVSKPLLSQSQTAFHQVRTSNILSQEIYNFLLLELTILCFQLEIK